MNLRFGYDASRARGWFAALFGVVLVFGLVAGAAGDLPKDRPARAGGRGLGPSTVALGLLMDVNRVLMSLTDKAEIGAASSSVSGGGAWRAITDQYIFSSGVNIGATVTKPGGGLDTLVMIGGPFSEIRPGRLAPYETRSGSTRPGSDLSVFWLSSDPADLAEFPLVCTVDDFRIGLFPSLGPFKDQPFPGFADLTVCLAANDVDGSTCSSCGGTRLGAETNQTYFAFSIPAVQDFFFVAMRIFNRSEFVTPLNTPGNNVFGPYDFNDTVVAIAIDPDLGDAGDDQIGFLPAPTNTMVWWDSDFSESFQFNPPGFGGVSYLKTPEDPVTGEEVGLQNFTVFTNGGSRPDPSSRQEWYQGMTGDPDFVVFDVAPQDVRGMASSGKFPLPAGEFVEIYAAYFFAEPFGPTPTELTTNNAIVNGVPIPIFNNFVAAQAAVQGVFNAGFLIPTAPPSPVVELIPGDHQVTILWDAGPVLSVNPFAAVALDPFLRDENQAPNPDAPGLGIFLDAGQIVFVPSLNVPGTTAGFVTAGSQGLTGAEVTNPLFNPVFVIQDFQGFRVYRSFDGTQDNAELIAQFDLNDAIASGTVCISGTAVTDPVTGELIQAVCTGTVEQSFGGNSGLVFGVVDRGGVFPNPSQGPGLINGIPVYYAVTSVGVNCGVFTVSGISEEFIPSLSPSPQCLALESGKNLNPATPRSNASSFVDAQVVGGAVLISNTTDAVVASSPGTPLPIGADGLLTGPIPAADAWSGSVEILQPDKIPANFEIRIVIDSIPIAYEWFGCAVDDCAVMFTGPAFSQVPEGDQRGRAIHFHLEDGEGNRLNSPSGPAQASMFTDFHDFTGQHDVIAPPLSILSPSDPDAGPVAIVQWQTAIGERDTQCARAGAGEAPCELLTEIGGGLPASVAAFDFDPAIYGQVAYGDIELTWGNTGGVLTLTVHDLSNDVPVQFKSKHGDAFWGFAAETGLGPEEAAYLAARPATPTTATGKVLWPDPLFSAFGGQTAGYGTIWQAGPDWTDLSTNPAIFDLLTPSLSAFIAEFAQPDALSETATLFTCPAAGGNRGCGGAGAGKQGTRFEIYNNWLQVSFNQLPADGETWLLRLPNSLATAPRMPVPGTALRFNLAGGSNELANADLQAITVVPNPFIAANEITRGRGRQRVLFTNLPTQATIRIYTISGNLVRILEHGDGSGTEEWDVRTRFDLLVASGNYYFHVTTPDGRTHLGRFAVIN